MIASRSSTPETYTHDVRGNLVFLPHLNPTGPELVPSLLDQMLRSGLNSTDYGLSRYAAASQGVRVLRPNGGSRFAILDNRTVGATTGSVTRYQLGNHLGSGAVANDEDGARVSHEECHPYRSTAWWPHFTSVSSKRYKYTRMEPDDETTLQSHGVRNYAARSGTWISADPIGLGDGVNRFVYCHGNAGGIRHPKGVVQYEGNDLGTPADRVPESGQATQLELRGVGTGAGLNGASLLETAHLDGPLKPPRPIAAATVGLVVVAGLGFAGGAALSESGYRHRFGPAQ